MNCVVTSTQNVKKPEKKRVFFLAKINEAGKKGNSFFKSEHWNPGILFLKKYSLQHDNFWASKND